MREVSVGKDYFKAIPLNSFIEVKLKGKSNRICGIVHYKDRDQMMISFNKIEYTNIQSISVKFFYMNGG